MADKYDEMIDQELKQVGEYTVMSIYGARNLCGFPISRSKTIRSSLS